jgi:predicted ATP-grasp superfamily ATP-dependent carboligase
VYPDPFENESAFIECMLAKVEELKPKMLIPTHDESQVIMKHRYEFPDDLIIPYDDFGTLKRLSNKKDSTAIAKSIGLLTPVVYSSADSVDSFPCVIKPSVGNSAKGLVYVTDRNELNEAINDYKYDDYLIEERVDGIDYSVDCVRWKGFFKASTYRAVVTKTYGGGTTSQRIVLSEPELENYAKLFLDSVDYQGICGIDFKFSELTKRGYFIEANARFTGGLASQIAAGFDIPWILYNLASSGVYKDIITIQSGTKTKWILGDIITFVDRAIHFNFSKEEMHDILSFKGFEAFDDYRSDDKRAILGEFEYYLYKLIRYRKLNP